MSPDPLDGLNDAQRTAAEAVRGPVCILAGAGSGKTTTITRRIAHQVASGGFAARDVLALTFTDRAARELRERLEGLGIPGGVRARTFHAEALAQVAHFRGAPELLPAKAEVLAPLVRRLPKPYRFRATKDVAAEIERAKNRRVGPSTYLDDLGAHTPPLPPDLMVRVFRTYETRKAEAGRADFEDLLGLAIELLEEDAAAAERIRGRYRAFTVDEYQDVNTLQQALLDAWLGGRDEVCVVGDDYQSIYGFTGATPDWLLTFPDRYPGATVVALEQSYRSTPQVLETANRLTGRLGGREKVLRAVRPPGPETGVVEHATGAEEARAITDEVDRLAREGVPFEEMAILYRINARSETFEEALSAARIPYQVRDGAFLRRPGPRSLLRRLDRADPGAPAVDAVGAAARRLGWDPGVDPDDAEGTEEATRLADLNRMVRLAEEFGGELGAFLADLRRRFTGDGAGRGVVLSTYHRAKGLEWDAVFLPRLEERELPFRAAKGDDEVAEERRLLYVGITRARRHLRISWARTRGGRSVRPSRFVGELRPVPKRTAAPRPPDEQPADPELFGRLRAWRKETADAQDVPAYVVFHDATLREICERRPGTLGELAGISGVGPKKLDRYGTEVLALVAAQPASGAAGRT